MADDFILQVQGLRVAFAVDGGERPVVHGVDFAVRRGQTLGIVGESGSGKSVSCMSLMHLLPPAARVSGSALFRPSDGEPVNLLGLSEAEVRTYRGKHISMVFQEPMTSLNPVHRCGDQVVEMLRQHEQISYDDARRRVLDLFDEVMLPRPEKIFSSYPHEISGGQKQRVMIAMALVCHPDLVIADEPTTALDVTVQHNILALLRTLQRKYNIGVIFITHDLGVVAQVADEVAVMYHGSVVERGPADQVLHRPSHPYTQGLIACRPPLDSRPRRLPTVADYLHPNTTSIPLNPLSPSIPHPLVEVRDLRVDYVLQRSFWGKPKQLLHAVDGVSFDIMEGETLGLVGESGCGKSTLGRALLRLIKPASGTVSFDGTDLSTLAPRAMRDLRRRMQIVFQDPYSSLNPHLTVGEAVFEPLKFHGMLCSDEERWRRVGELLEKVGLDSDSLRRYPHEFSGGQRQRVVIARALALEPRLVICDESVSALDVSVQAQVLNLLNELKEVFGYTYLFITHDLSVVKFLSDRVMVMQKGKIVESGEASQLFAEPKTDYTRQLLDAIPRL